MKKLFSKVLIFLCVVLFLTSCEAYIEFEIFRTKAFVIVFIVTLVIGVIGLLFSKKDSFMGGSPLSLIMIA